MGKLVVISYNEGEQDFYDSDVSSLLEKVITINPNIICICTQKSKSQVAVVIPGKAVIQKKLGFEGSNSTKHFPHVFGNLLLQKNYKLIYKKDASFMLRGVTENNNVRTRIYQLNIPNTRKYNVIDKLSSTIGSVQTMTLNRQAIYVELDIDGKKTIIVNTELAPSFNQRKQREKEFLDIIEEFKLAQKYEEGYNIILCGSLNFRLKFLTVVNEQAKLNLFNYLSQYIKNKNSDSMYPNKFLNRNELRLYMKNLIKNIENNEKNQNIKDLQIFTEAFERNRYLKKLLEKFIFYMEITGFAFNCNHELGNKNYRVYNPLKMGSIIKSTTNTWNTSHSIYKKKNNSAMGVISGFGKGITSGVYRTLGKAITPIIRHAPIISNNNKNYFTENKKEEKKNFKLPAMCDKILFALSENQNTLLQYDEFEVFQDLKKSKNKLIYVTFSF